MKTKKELTCEESERLAEEIFESAILSSKIGWEKYSRENQ